MTDRIGMPSTLEMLTYLGSADLRYQIIPLAAVKAKCMLSRNLDIKFVTCQSHAAG